jgi:hypothetical protein
LEALVMVQMGRVMMDLVVVDQEMEVNQQGKTAS